MGAVGDDFYAAVLNSLGAPVTPNNLQLCRQWQAYEGGSALWNPWNTTQWAQGATEYNSAHVRNFPDEQTGISATVSTLRNGYYPSIVATFTADLPESEWGLNPAILNEINLWGTHGFAAYLQSIAQSAPGPTPAPSPNSGGKQRVVILNVDNNGGQWLLSGGLVVQLQDPKTVAAFIAAGVSQVAVTFSELQAIVAASRG